MGPPRPGTSPPSLISDIIRLLEGYPLSEGILIYYFMKLSGRHKRYMVLAARMAHSSSNEDYRHGAILLRGSNIIGLSTHQNRHASFGNRFRQRNCGHATHHAELGCILGLDRKKTMGATMYVCRIGKGGELRLSKPCSMCAAVLRHVGVRRVFYSIDNKTMGVYKP